MAFRPNREDDRRREFKKGIDAEEGRRKREDLTVKLRKSRRDEQIAKRRQQAQGGSYVMGAQGAAGQSGPTSLYAPQGASSTSSGLQPMGGGGSSSRDPEIEEKLREIPSLVAALSSQDTTVRLQSVQRFRRLLSIERDPPIQQVIQAGVVPAFVQFLRDVDNPTIQFEAAWALTNIASGSSDDTLVVVNNGAIPIFVELLRSPSPEVREQAVWGLGNIAGDSPALRDAVLAAGILPTLLMLFTPDAKITLRRNATWTLSNLCRGKPPPRFELISSVLPQLAKLIWMADEEILTDACWALSYISDDSGPGNERIQAVVKSSAARRLIELLMHRSTSVRTPALRTVGNIVTGDDVQTQVVINYGGLENLRELLSHSKHGIRKEACWTISNITAGNQHQIQSVLDANIMPSLVHVLRTNNFDIKKEAAWAISNATSGGTPQQIRTIVEMGAIPPLCSLLTSVDTKVILVALEGLENILRVGEKDATEQSISNRYADFIEEAGGTEKMEALQENENLDVYNKAVAIVRTYFGGTEVGAEDEAFAPSVGADGAYNFGAGGGQHQPFNFGGQ